MYLQPKLLYYYYIILYDKGAWTWHLLYQHCSIGYLMFILHEKLKTACFTFLKTSIHILTRIRKPPKKDLRCKKGGKVLVQAGAQVPVSSSGHYYTGLLHNMKTWVAVWVEYCSIVYCYHRSFGLRILWLCQLIQLRKKRRGKGLVESCQQKWVVNENCYSFTLGNSNSVFA